MPREIVFPDDDPVGLLFAADRSYCLVDSSIEWLGEASGVWTLPEAEYIGLVFNNNVSLRRRFLKDLDLNCIQMLYFHNPFELLFDELIEELGSLEKAVLNTAPDDTDCELLAALHGLRAINLTESNISDQGLHTICELQSLESLVLAYTSISDLGLQRLSQLIDLRELDLSLTMITDQGLEKIAELKTLEELRLNATAISDEGIAPLLALSRLSYLDLSETAVSEAGLELIQAELPDCQINY
ncbi:MAG: hypothetical protein K2X27_01615 [Candidatus Obscuribacterales bacterium]|nr:hypothetical protein [Candidatus Obscuribacterales bacterium]